MSVVRVAIPVTRGKRRFHIDKGRTWSVVEHLVLVALTKKNWSAQGLADELKLPRRIVIEAIIRLMDAAWVELLQRAEGVEFRATELGRSVSAKEELPTNPRRIKPWRNFITDKVTGTVYRGRELAVFEKHVLEKRAEQEQFVWIDPREIDPEDHVKAVIETLFDDDERFISIEPSGDRLVDRFAVVTYRNEKVEGLPTRAPRELEEIIRSAAKTFVPRAPAPITFTPASVAQEVDQMSLVPRPVAFRADDLVLGATDHRQLLDSIVKSCRHELIIHSTFIADDRAGAVMPTLIAAVKRGVRVNVLWGQDDEKSQVNSTRKVVGRLRQSISDMAFDDVFQVHPFSTKSHAKLIVADAGIPDQHVAVIGSCNWLSSGIQSFECSVRVRDPSLVADVIDQLAELSLGSDGHWTELTSYLASLAINVRRESVPSGARGNAHLVLGPEHGAMVRRARDTVKNRIFVTSHRFSSVGRPAVIIPVIAAADANENLEAKVYYGIPSGDATSPGRRAADVTMEAALAGVRIRPVREPRVHAKILAWDDDYAVITSQNWLSADPGEGSRRKEIGIFLHAAGVARRVIDVFETARKS
jgi:cardiolipin synthase A/B